MTEPTSRDLMLVRRYRRAALIAVLIAGLGVLFVFTKRNPVAHHFKLNAVFSSAAQLHNRGEVRIGGIQVGKVTGIKLGPGHAATVAMTIDGKGLPIHADSRLAIKPRLLLEGNAYIDLQPGSASSPVVRSGSSIGVAQTSVAVQIDQVLDTFDTPTRDALHQSVASLDAAFGRGKTGDSPPGWKRLREATRQLDGALRPVTQVTHALQGTQPGDMRRTISATGDLATQLVKDPKALAGIVSHYNTTFAALASESDSLAGSISGFDDVAKVAPARLRQIDAALPSLTHLANVLRPTVRVARPVLASVNRLLHEVGGLVANPELPTLLDRLKPVVRNLPSLTSRLRSMFSYSAPVTDCISSHIVPGLSLKVPDGATSTGDPAYLDLVHLYTAMTSFSSAVDGNGGTVRLGVALGSQTVDHFVPGLGKVVARIPDFDGVRPKWLGYGVIPTFRPDQPCARQQIPNLAEEPGLPPAWATGK